MGFYKIRLLVCCVVFMIFFTAPVVFAEDFSNVPVKGMVTMVDLGSKQCVPCKMMAPIMVKLEKAYEGKAAIIFIDVWKKENKEQGSRFKIRAIPTQIFFDAQGNEVFRHVGFFDEKPIVDQLTRMGVAKPAPEGQGS